MYLRRAPRGRRHAADPIADRSLRHSLRDAMAYAVMQGGAETYFSAFALFCRAGAAQVALLSTLPPLLGSLAQLLGAWLARHARRRKPVILGGVLFQALTLLPILTVPLLPRAFAVPALLVLYACYFAGNGLAAPPWTSLMGDTVPEHRRGRFFATRTRLTQIMSFSALVAAGLALHRLSRVGATGMGFFVIFCIACVARLVSAWHLSRMHEPAGGRIPAPTEMFTTHALRVLRRTGALWFSLYAMLMQGAVAMSGPFFAVYMLRDLQFTYLEYMLNAGTAVLFQFVALRYWGRISDAFGNRLILSVCGLGVPAVPLLWVVSDNFWYLLLVQCLSGVFWGGFTLSTGNLLYELVPPVRRASYTAFHNIMVAACVFAGAMSSILLLDLWVPRATLFGDPARVSALLNLFLLSAAARLAVDLLLLRRVRDLRRPRRRLSARQFVLRATGFDALVGAFYEGIPFLKSSRRR
jgi:MFS family permease